MLHCAWRSWTFPWCLLFLCVDLRSAPVFARPCIGDCTIDTPTEMDALLTCVRIALGAMDRAACVGCDTNNDGRVTVDEPLRVLIRTLTGCAAPTATPTPRPMLPPTPTNTATETADSTSAPTGTDTPTATCTSTSTQTPRTPASTATPMPSQDATATATDRPTCSAAAGPCFHDVTVAAGLDYVQGTSAALPLNAGYYTGGAAAGDYDNDGWVDLFVTRLDSTPILFRNQGDGTFADVTALSGLDAFNLPFNGAAWADIDNDGDLDLYVTTFGEHQERFYLFINDGHGHFTEEAVARGAAIEGAGRRYGFSVSFGDYDRDGWLDIFVAEWNPSYPPGRPSYTRLLHNRGSDAPGFFTDVTTAAGVRMDDIPTNAGFHGAVAFAPRFVDLDNDGWPDLAIAADFGQSRLFWNNRDGTFTDGTVAAGVGTEENGMGSAIGDYDNDGALDWFVTSVFDPLHTCDLGACSWRGSGNRLYHNDGHRQFSDRTDANGVRDGSWGWGTAFFDYDNDGDLDLLMTNGVDFSTILGDAGVDLPFRTDQTRLWRNDRSHFTDVADQSGIIDTGPGKGVLTFDYDHDGDLDVFITNTAARPILYRNDGGNRNDWLRVNVTGTVSNRNGLGTRVTVQTIVGGEVQLRELDAGSHFLGQSEFTAHFGLGKGDTPIHEVRVVWPKSGAVQVFNEVARNTTLSVVEPASTP